MWYQYCKKHQLFVILFCHQLDMLQNLLDKNKAIEKKTLFCPSLVFISLPFIYPNMKGGRGVLKVFFVQICLQLCV